MLEVVDNLKERVTIIIERLNEGIHEREEIIAVSFLAALSNQNVFLIGPPGTAKSLIARRLSYAFETGSYFEYLMHRFSTPEEIFGPVSITELKKDNFLRKTEGFLPESEFAFLDEIWKSSPPILNTLLTIINEKLFRNGTEVNTVPLKALIAASNETPPPGQGLEALFDRFSVRLNVPLVESKDNFENVLGSQPTCADLNMPDGLTIKNAEWEAWCKEIHSVELSKETLNIIHDIRLSLEEKGEKLDVYISDRRWQKAAILLKAAAFFCGRKETNLVDTLLLRHCLWTTKDDREDVAKIVEDAVRTHGFETGFGLDDIDSEKEELEQEIKKEFYYSEDVYETKIIGRKKCFEVGTKDWPYKRRSVPDLFYIPKGEMKGKEKFSPIDSNGNEVEDVTCCFDTQGSCAISYYNSTYSRYETTNFTPSILFHKDDKKEGVNSRLVSALHEGVKEMKERTEYMIMEIEDKLSQFKDELESPFVSEGVRNIAVDSVYKQLEELKLRRKDCDRLSGLVG